ncbi:hypothetical protein IMSHALPRED_010462, partial [Imshaugia aleurites]
SRRAPPRLPPTHPLPPLANPPLTPPPFPHRPRRHRPHPPQFLKPRPSIPFQIQQEPLPLRPPARKNHLLQRLRQLSPFGQTLLYHARTRVSPRLPARTPLRGSRGQKTDWECAAAGCGEGVFWAGDEGAEEGGWRV